MNLKVLVIILFLSLFFFFGFNKISNFRNETRDSDFGELNILKYLPKDNKLLFISNFKSSNIINNIKKDSNTKNLEQISLIKNSILNYLGLDLSNNKLRDIYSDELIVSTYENNKNIKDDILIVFKINPEKELNDILNINYKTDNTSQIIPIFRENKINYLHYIYRTKDDYIIASSDKKLITYSIESVNNLKEKEPNYLIEIKRNFKNQNNILFRKEFENNSSLNNKPISQNKQDITATTFSLEGKYLILKSYLINNNKNLDISSYDELRNKNIIDEGRYEVTTYSNLNNSIQYLNTLINDFEKNLLKEFNQKVKQNILLLNSQKDWIIAFENNDQNQSLIKNIEKLKDFHKDSFENNNNIYTIYSKNNIHEDAGTIKISTYKNVFSIESKKLFIISNNLITGKNLDLIVKKFFDFKNNTDSHDFLYEQYDIKGKNFLNLKYISYLEDLNFLLKDIIDSPSKEFTKIIKQSVPEKNPILYTENKIKIFQ